MHSLACTHNLLHCFVLYNVMYKYFIHRVMVISGGNDSIIHVEGNDSIMKGMSWLTRRNVRTSQSRGCIGKYGNKVM